MARRIGVLSECKYSRCQQDFDGNVEITFQVAQEGRYALHQIVDEINRPDMPLTITIQKSSKRRTLDQNAYLWCLLDEIAKAVRSSKWDVYLEMIERYGPWDLYASLPEAVDHLRRVFRVVRDRGTVVVSGKEVVKCQCYPGSSTYDQEQMTVLLNGVVDECQRLGIPTAPQTYEERCYL